MVFRTGMGWRCPKLKMRSCEAAEGFVRVFCQAGFSGVSPGQPYRHVYDIWGSVLAFSSARVYYPTSED